MDGNEAQTLQNAIVAEGNARIYLWPKWAVGFENISQEAIREETPLQSLQVFPGQYRITLSFKENLEIYKAMHSHDNTSGRVFWIDHEKKLIGTSNDDGQTLKGFSLQDLDVGNAVLNDGSVSSKIPVSLYHSDYTELNDLGFMLEGKSFLNALQPLISVKLTASATATATDIYVSVNSAYDGIGVIGLVDADFTVENGTIGGVVDNGDGTYVISGTAFASGNVDLVSAANISLLPTLAIESAGPLAITI
jgi:hypothetical protein